jgi:hypothetical protein
MFSREQGRARTGDVNDGVQIAWIHIPRYAVAFPRSPLLAAKQS